MPDAKKYVWSVGAMLRVALAMACFGLLVGAVIGKIFHGLDMALIAAIFAFLGGSFYFYEVGYQDGLMKEGK